MYKIYQIRISCLFQLMLVNCLRVSNWSDILIGRWYNRSSTDRNTIWKVALFLIPWFSVSLKRTFNAALNLTTAYIWCISSYFLSGWYNISVLIEAKNRRRWRTRISLLSHKNFSEDIFMNRAFCHYSSIYWNCLPPSLLRATTDFDKLKSALIV